jgi:hypothetical protein
MYGHISILAGYLALSTWDERAEDDQRGGRMGTPRSELEKMTAPKLRELAIAKYSDITGVSGMKKEELVEAIIAEEVSLGLRPKEEKTQQATAAMGSGQLKTAIRVLKGERKTALEGRERARLKTVRLQIKRMKRRLRKLREAS